MQLRDLDTPQVLIEQPRLLANVDRLQSAAAARGLRLRPHAKTHKSPVIARWQLERGAVGVCCAKLGEAEVFAEAGVEDIRLPYPLNPSKAPRLLALMDRARISFIVDHLGVARGWSEVMQRAGRSVDVLIKVDVGFHRCGIDPALPGALEFVKEVSALPGLRFRGLLSHAGHGYNSRSEQDVERVAREEAHTLRTLANAARGAGIEVAEVSVGATPTLRYSLAEDGLTELRPGNYVYYDRSQVGLGAAAITDCALTVLATVVSKPADDRIILDSGSKTLTTDRARGWSDPEGFGAVFPQPDATHPDDTLVVERLSEEHAVVHAASGTTPLEPGDRVRILPNHSCVVSNMVDAVQLVDGLTVLGPLPVAARGRIR